MTNIKNIAATLAVLGTSSLSIIHFKGYKVEKILGSIYSVSFSNKTDLWKTFVRYQEYYESPKYHGKSFTLKEFKSWYTQEYGGGEFTYEDDWAAFNIPSFVIDECRNAKDLNKYDTIMQDIYKEIGLSDFYLLGVTDLGSDEDLPHEIAHGLFFTDEEYRNLATDLVDNMPEKDYEKIRSYLIGVGYCEHVLIDEIQAYMATGVSEKMNFSEKLHKPFISLFIETKLKIIKRESCEESKLPKKE